MGWWPFSSSQSSSVQSPDAALSSTLPVPGNASAASSRIPPPPPPPVVKADNPDGELQSFLASFESPKSPSARTHESITAPNEPIPAQAIASTTSTTAPVQTPSGELDISPEAMYPRSMSCRQAFDQAFYCQSLGGKFNDIYRYGALQSCSEQWDAFWFCMRVKSQGEEEKQQAISRYYREREERKKKEKGSSEDVWEIRMEPVKKAFWRDPDAPVLKAGDDALTRASKGSSS